MRTLVIVVLLVLVKPSQASFQVGDFLIYKDDTVVIHSQPLEALYDQSTRPDSILSNKNCWPFNCWRGYIALWLIEDSNLYLLEVKTCCAEELSFNKYPAEGEKYDLGRLVDMRYFKNGRVEANWVSFCLYNPLGPKIYGRNQGYYAFYKEERLFCFEGGKLTSIEYYDNPKTKYNTLYAANNDSLLELFIKE